MPDISELPELLPLPFRLGGLKLIGFERGDLEDSLMICGEIQIDANKSAKEQIALARQAVEYFYDEELKKNDMWLNYVLRFTRITLTVVQFYAAAVPGVLGR